MDDALRRCKARQRRSMFIVIGTVVVLVVLIGIGVGVGVSMSKNKDSNTKSNSGSSSPSSSNDPSPDATQSDPNDPSNFTKDPRLHKSFYGMAYTPENSQMPACGNKLEDVIKDIQLISQLTGRIRLYGADCNQTALVLEAIKQTKVEMEVFLGNYVLPEQPDVYTRQRDVLRDALVTYGADNVAGITVGNEFMLNFMKGATDVNGPIGTQGAAMLIADIKDTRDMIASLSLSKNIPVGNSDAGSYFNTEVLSAIDYGMSNVHAWFANTTDAAAAGWVSTFFNETNVIPASLLPNKPKMYIAETGWPTESSDISNANNGASPASITGLQTFLDTFVCQANQNGTGYFFFEFFDEEWKDKQFGGVEGHWGLFTKDRVLKDITIPDCPAP